MSAFLNFVTFKKKGQPSHGELAFQAVIERAKAP
jgi:hypothetical protein